MSRADAAYAAWRKWQQKRFQFWSLGIVEHVIEFYVKGEA